MFEIEARDDDALPAEMGVAAERARRLQERRSLNCLRKQILLAHEVSF